MFIQKITENTNQLIVMYFNCWIGLPFITMFYVTDTKKAQYVHNFIAILYNIHDLHFADEAKWMQCHAKALIQK